ncbi:sialin isoform X2 [Cylas formicarius]|uniref:sialin isoform X2 n=1 Tax=Cylas formicarius TaxID=197179 RepID=UPI0029583F85|nr:sialin isoform X2 [Cylas formicarius]
MGKLATRYVLAVLGSIGMGIVYGLKVNLHVAIVGMVNHTALATSGPAHGGAAADDGTASETPEDGPFEWSSNVQGVLLSAYFWGYMVAQIPGGRIAEQFSAKWVMLFSVAINVICTLLSPCMAELHYAALIVMRVGEGIGGGVTFPAMHVMLAHWAPPNERSVMSSIVYAGTALGTVIFMLVSGLIAGAIGWEYVFYIEGGASAIWLVLWIVLIADTPQQQRFITPEEREYIVKSLHQDQDDAQPKKRKLKMPWRAAMTSPAFLAILIAHTCSNWGWYMVLIELPTYMSSVLKFKISQNAVLTALPFLCMWIFSMVLSKTLDTLRTKDVISTTTARKTATACASIVPMVCFLLICYAGDNTTVAVVLMTVAVMSVGGMFCGFLSNHIDIAPNYAGTLVAVTNTVATIPGITVPIFVGELIKHDSSKQSWIIIFWVTIVLYLIEAIVYLIFASGEEQSWNKIEDDPGEFQPLKQQNGQSPKTDRV